MNVFRSFIFIENVVDVTRTGVDVEDDFGVVAQDALLQLIEGLQSEDKAVKLKALVGDARVARYTWIGDWSGSASGHTSCTAISIDLAVAFCAGRNVD